LGDYGKLLSWRAFGGDLERSSDCSGRVWRHSSFLRERGWKSTSYLLNILTIFHLQ
jgi:hypothetical protein